MARTYTDILADIDAAKRRLAPILEEVDEIARMEDPNDGQIQRQTRMVTAAERVHEELEALRAEQLAFAEEAAGFGRTEDVRPGGWVTRNGHDGRRESARSIRRRNKRGEALDHIERHAAMLGGDAAEWLTESIETDLDTENRLADYVIRTGRDDYMSAFVKMMRDPNQGHLEFGPAELDAWRDVQELNRAMNIGTGSAGGFLVPYQLDPQIRISSAGSVDPMRRVASVKTVAVNEARFLTTAGVTASWDAEAAEVSDDSPVLTQPSITAFKGAAFLPVSFELYEDSDIARQAAELMADAKRQLEATAFTLGTGSGQPKGVITAVSAVPSSVITTPDTAYTVSHIASLQSALPARWRPNARFMMNLNSMTAYRVLSAVSGGPAMLDDSSNPARMFGWEVVENSVMDGTITASANDYLMLAGDFSQYQIIDRVGTTMELVPHLFGANGRPTGQRGFYLHWRTGGDVLIADAFRLLNFSA